MILSWMMYALILSALIALAATALERAARMLRLQARWVWVTAMAASVTVPLWLRFGAVVFAAPQTTDAAAAVGASPSLSVLLPLLNSISNPSSQILVRTNDLAGITWAAASIALTLVLLVGTVRLSRSMRLWPEESAGTQTETVRVSGRFGPALIGLLHPEIVLPRWVLGLSQDRLDLILLHEAEHRRAYDPVVLAGAVGCVFLMPWNPVSWWQLSRLRRAVELDCDHRVLRRGVPRLIYGEVLLDVGARAARVPLPLAALTNPVSLLERRIRMITAQAPEGRIRKAATAVALAGLVIAGACEAPTPSEVVETNAESLVTPSLEVNSTLRLPGGNLTLGDEKVQPLIYIDGVRMNGDATGMLNTLSPNDIERIEVIKGPAAAELYGAKAEDGVILITLKEGAQPEVTAAIEASFDPDDPSDREAAVMRAKTILKRRLAEFRVDDEPVNAQGTISLKPVKGGSR